MPNFGSIRSDSTQLRADAGDPTKVRISAPIYTTAERDALTPAVGEEVWNSTDNCQDFYNGVAWSRAPVIDVFSRYKAAGTTDTLATRYALLADAQAAYPLAGITSLSDTIDWAAVQQAINENIGFGEGRILEFGPHVYYTGNGKTFGVKVVGDTDARLHLRGGGCRGTRLQQTDVTVPCFEIHNTHTSGNVRDVKLENLHFYEGKHSLFMRRSAYCRAIDCSSFRPGAAGANTGTDYFSIRSEICTSTWIRGFLSQHGVTSDLIYSESSTLLFSDCNLGEDAGGIVQTGGTLNFTNCNGVQMILRTTPVGAFAAAGGAVYVTGGGSFSWIGGNITLSAARTCVILGDQAGSINITGATIDALNASDAVIGLRRVPATYRSRIVGVSFTMNVGDALIQLYDNAEPVRNTQIDDLLVRVAGGDRSTIWSDDSLFDPQYNNEIGSILVLPT